MNRADYLGEVRNFNGNGIWSLEAVQIRYRAYCADLQIECGRSLEPIEFTQGDIRWIYPIMDQVIPGIEEGDLACIALGVDFVEEDTLFPFGRILKSNTARALRRCQLNEAQKSRLMERISTMLVSGNIPREMRECAKLLRKTWGWRTLAHAGARHSARQSLRDAVLQDPSSRRRAASLNMYAHRARHRGKHPAQSGFRLRGVWPASNISRESPL